MNRSKYLSQLKAKNVEVHIKLLTDEEVKELLSLKNGWEESRSSGVTTNIFEKIDFHVSKLLKKSAIADTGFSPQVNDADAESSQVNIAHAGPSQVNIAGAGPSSQVNIEETCTSSLTKKSYESNISSQLINLTSTLPPTDTSSVSSAVHEDAFDSKLTNAFFKDFTIQTSEMNILPCKKRPSSLVDDRKDDRKRPCISWIRLPAGVVPKKRKADSTSILGSDSSLTHIGSSESALTKIQSNCTTNIKLCGAENFTTDLEVKKHVGERQAYQTPYSSSNSSQANFSEAELDRMMINESDIASAKSFTNISFNTMSENEPKEGTKIAEQGNDMFLDQESIITSNETSQEETARAEQKISLHLELDYHIERLSSVPNLDCTDIINDTRDFRAIEFQEVGNQNKEETESSSSTSELPEILNKKQGQETGETESLIEVPRESTDDKMNTYTLARHLSYTSNPNLEKAVPFPFYAQKAVFTESHLSAKATCESKQDHYWDSTSCIDHLLYTSEHNWECQKNRNKEDVELFVTPNQNIKQNSINAHASYSCQFSEEHESGIPLLVNHYSKEQFDHENISLSIENVPNHNILEEQVENGKTNMWTCSVGESPQENMEMDISCSDDVQKYLEDALLNQLSENSSSTCPHSQNSYDAKDEMCEKTTIATYTSVHCDAFVNNEILNEGMSIKQVALNQDDKIDPYEKLVKDGVNGMDSYLDNGNWFGVCVEETLQIETTAVEHGTSFSENHNQAAFPYEIMQEQTETNQEMFFHLC